MDNASRNLHIKPFLEVIQGLKDKTIPPDSLDHDTKINCVDILLTEGYPQHQIAFILKISDRTVRRYKKIIRKIHSVKLTPEFIREYIGDLIVKVEMNYDSLIRLASSNKTKPNEEIFARMAAWKLKKELTKVLQAMGYLGDKEGKEKVVFGHVERPSPPPIIHFHGVPSNEKPPEEYKG